MRECDRWHAELVKLEREELRRAITGDQYETLWGQCGIAEVEALVSDDDVDEFDEDDDGLIVEDDEP